MHAAGREQRDALVAEEPAGRLGCVARVGVLGQQHDQAALELLVQRRERRAAAPARRRARASAARRRTRWQPLLRAEALDEAVENGTVHDDGPNGRSAGASWYAVRRGGERRRSCRSTSRERIDRDAGAGVRRVDEQAAADVEPDVAEAVEEDEVARAERRARDAAAEANCAPE